MVAAVAYMCRSMVFGSMRYKVRHAGYVYIMMFAILAFQQKQINMFFTLPFRGLVFHANVPHVGIIEKYIYTQKRIPTFDLRYLFHLHWELCPSHVRQIFIFLV